MTTSKETSENRKRPLTVRDIYRDIGPDGKPTPRTAEEERHVAREIREWASMMRL